ncbi:MAG: hypothetical protein IT423_08020 [Pirellulaceae bacterium]|nr:hypothetical protein [Pirellulaceae bacterium]
MRQPADQATSSSARDTSSSGAVDAHPTPPAKPSLGKRLLQASDVVGRVLLSLAVVIAAIYCVNIAWQLRYPAQREASLPASDAATALDRAMHNMLVGSWQFVGLPWHVSIRELSEAEALVQLERPLPPQPTDVGSVLGPNAAHNAAQGGAQQAAADLDEDNSATSGLLYALLTQLGAQPPSSEAPSSQPAVVEYSFEQAAGMRGMGFASTSRPEQIQCVRLMQPIGNDRWNFIELVVLNSAFPASASTARESSDGSLPSELLPLDQDSEKLAMRMDAAGQLCGELIRLGQPLDALRARWQQAGWQVAVMSEIQSQAAQAEALRETFGATNSPTAQVLICTREQEVVIAIPAPGLLTEHGALLLVRGRADE